MFKQSLEQKLAGEKMREMGLEEKVECLQRIFRQTCQTKIRRRQVSAETVDSWWDGRLIALKRLVQMKKRVWQRSRTEVDKRTAEREGTWHRACGLIHRKNVYVPVKDLQKDTFLSYTFRRTMPSRTQKGR